MQKNRNNCTVAALGLSLFVVAIPSHAVTAGKGTVGSADVAWQDADSGPTMQPKSAINSSAQKGKPPVTARFNYCVLPKVLNDTETKLVAAPITVKVTRDGKATDLGALTTTLSIERDKTFKHNDAWCEMGVVGIGPPTVRITLSGTGASAKNGGQLQHAITFPAKLGKTVNLRDHLLGISPGNPKDNPPPQQ